MVFILVSSTLSRMVSTPNSYYRISSAVRAPLRIGLLLDSREEISAFFARIIEDIKASNFAGIECCCQKNYYGEAGAGRTTELPCSQASAAHIGSEAEKTLALRSLPSPRRADEASKGPACQG